MSAPTPIGTADLSPPPAAVMRMLAQHSREQLEGFIEVALSLLDFADGDPDVEEDDPAGQCDEDGINTSFARARHDGPGCLISDGDRGADDDGEPEPLEPDRVSPIGMQ